MDAEPSIRETISRRVSTIVAGLVTSTWLRDVRRTVADLVRRGRGRSHEVYYFHQVDDPYSHLTAQVLGRLVDGYDVVLRPHVVGPPPDDAAPERALLEAYARKDAADVAPSHGLTFPRVDREPRGDLVRLANRMLVRAGREAFVARAADVGHAVWGGDEGLLERMASGLPPASEADTDAALAASGTLRAKLGHYLGATFFYEGEWYWGVDRLAYLTERLDALGARRPRGAAVVTAPSVPLEASARRERAERLQLEFFPSLRSPYSYVAMERVFALPSRYPVELRIRPVLPMVMRGLPVPLAKRLYILRDTKREADRVGVPFGWVSDPVGAPVERAFGLWRWARASGREAEYLLACGRAAWADAVDLGSEVGLRHAVEAAGLSWADAQPHRTDDEWRAELEANRAAMFAAGLWGVPSFRLLGAPGEPDFCTWGQDRIWLVEQEIRRRLGRPAA